jgi:hypothetical protein
MSKKLKIFVVVFFVLIAAYILSLVYEQRQKAKEISSPENAAAWSEIQKNIQSCNVVRVAQTHSLEVGVWLKDGQSLGAKEPKIDDIWHLLDANTKKCGSMNFVTE